MQYVNELLTEVDGIQLHQGEILPNPQGPLVLRMVDKDLVMGLSRGRKTFTVEHSCVLTGTISINK